MLLKTTRKTNSIFLDLNMCKISFIWFKFVILCVLPSPYPKILQKRPVKDNKQNECIENNQ